MLLSAYQPCFNVHGAGASAEAWPPGGGVASVHVCVVSLCVLASAVQSRGLVGTPAPGGGGRGEEASRQRAVVGAVAVGRRVGTGRVGEDAT